MIEYKRTIKSILLIGISYEHTIAILKLSRSGLGNAATISHGIVHVFYFYYLPLFQHGLKEVRENERLVGEKSCSISLCGRFIFLMGCYLRLIFIRLCN